MANIKSSKKRIGVAEAKRERNVAVKSEIKTFLKKFDTAIQTNEKELATALYSKTSGLLDSAATDNVIHANKAARLKGRMAKQLGKISA